MKVTIVHATCVTIIQPSTRAGFLVRQGDFAPFFCLSEFDAFDFAAGDYDGFSEIGVAVPVAMFEQAERHALAHGQVIEMEEV